MYLHLLSLFSWFHIPSFPFGLSIIYQCFFYAWSQLTLGKRYYTPWTGHRSAHDRADIKSQTTSSLRLMSKLELPFYLSCMYLLWEDAGWPQENPQRHREIMQTTHRKAQSRTLLLWGRSANTFHHWSSCFYIHFPSLVLLVPFLQHCMGSRTFLDICEICY